ncbi:MAG: hypothetical protein JXR54_07665 [Tannerellaceae bacterium]|nr:hypothetical protein [Tannerellaceae bacterium]
MANIQDLSESLGVNNLSLPNVNTVASVMKSVITPDLINLPDKDEAFRAEAYYERLAEYIIDFEKNLEEDKEVGAKLVNFGETITIHVEDIGYYNPRLICFYGTDMNGQRVQLIQHVNQINLLLIALKREEKKERPRVGYKLAQQLKESEEKKEK